LELDRRTDLTAKELARLLQGQVRDIATGDGHERLARPDAREFGRSPWDHDRELERSFGSRRKVGADVAARGVVVGAAITSAGDESEQNRHRRWTPQPA